ncbi:MAG: hypothetical protein ABL907_05315, partial [Hyphomicrobium sp.]
TGLDSRPPGLPHKGGGEVARTATIAERNPEGWAALVERQGHGFTELTPLTPSEQADEMLLMGLRLTEGIDLARLARLGGVTPSREMLADLQGLGLLEVFERQSGPAATDAPPADWRSDELAEIRMCLGPGVPPQRMPAAAALRIRATPRGRFVLNAVVAKLSQSFEAVTPERLSEYGSEPGPKVGQKPGMDISGAGL